MFKNDVKITFFNGEFVSHENAMVHVDDRGFCFGDSIYDVFLVRDGKFIDFDWHVERLFRSIKVMQYDISSHEHLPQTKEDVANIANRLLSLNQVSNGFFFIQVSRGRLGGREHNSPNKNSPTYFITLSPGRASRPEWFTDGMKVISEHDIRWQRRDIKTSLLLPNAMSKQKALDMGYDDAIFVDNSIVTEGTSSNCFIVDQDGILLTHPASNKILPGITRRRVLQLCRELGIPYEEKSFTIDDFKRAKEAFLTNATLLLRPIGMVDDVVIGKPGNVTKSLIEAYNNFINQQ
jgi:D-alanine transaminase